MKTEFGPELSDGLQLELPDNLITYLRVRSEPSAVEEHCREVGRILRRLDETGIAISDFELQQNGLTLPASDQAQRYGRMLGSAGWADGLFFRQLTSLIIGFPIHRPAPASAAIEGPFEFAFESNATAARTGNEDYGNFVRWLDRNYILIDAFKQLGSEARARLLTRAATELGVSAANFSQSVNDALPPTVTAPSRPERPRQRSVRRADTAARASAAVGLITHSLNWIEPSGGSDTATGSAVQGLITATPRPIQHDPRAQYSTIREMAAIDVNKPLALRRLAENGAVVVTNGGQQGNCLILSLLQHAKALHEGTADYIGTDHPRYTELTQEAETLRTTLRLGQNMLYPDDPNFDKLLTHIREVYPKSRLQVTVATPAPQGLFVSFNICDPERAIQYCCCREVTTMRR